MEYKGAENNIEESTKVIIKPNVYSWRNINVSNAFYTSYNYKRELESHMMKNTEWGAVAYLTQSKYGRCTEEDEKTTCEEVRINNNSNFITGYSAKDEPTVGNGAYNDYEGTNLNEDGVKGYSYYNSYSKIASTTENYYGVYDMSGGAWEYVMGVMQGKSNNSKDPASGPNSTSNSGFNGPYTNDANNESLADGKEWLSSKYYDLYDYGAKSTIYQRGHLGDATKEFGPFYIYYNREYESIVSSYNADLANFVSSDGPWFGRGGARQYGTSAGIFSFIMVTGGAYNYDSFRIILTP